MVLINLPPFFDMMTPILIQILTFQQNPSIYSSRTSSLHRSGTSSTEKNKCVNCVQIDLNDPCASIEIPEVILPHDILRVQIYKAAVNDIVEQPTKVTDGMDCAIYHKNHTFEKCPILNDIPYIKKHFISYCILMNCTQKQMLAAIHCLDANWDTYNTTTDEHDGASNYSHCNTDNDINFEEEKG